MAQKAAKTLAARNTSILNRTLLLSLAFHGTFLLLRFLLLRRSLTIYALLSAPALIIQFWFERIGRPVHGPNGELRRSGEDLEAKGLTEWMWDVLYWTYLCLIIVAVIGDYGWWAYVSAFQALHGVIFLVRCGWKLILPLDNRTTLLRLARVDDFQRRSSRSGWFRRSKWKRSSTKSRRKQKTTKDGKERWTADTIPLSYNCRMNENFMNKDRSFFPRKKKLCI